MNKYWNVDTIINQIRACDWAMTDPRMDGFVTWGCKQDLYNIKFVLDEIIENAPTYVGEQEWLDEKAKEKTWKIISQ